MFLQSLFGLAAFVLLAWVLSENRRGVNLRLVSVGLVLQVALGALLLKAPACREIFLILNRMILALEEATQAGTAFVFGYLGGAPLPFNETFPGAGFILAFRALPLILVVSALSAVLFHWRVLPLIVRGFSWLMQRSMGIGGTEGLGAAANIFVGMVEAPLFIRPYLEAMSRSELFTVMTCGMATIAGTVMVLYASILGAMVPDVMGHLLSASIISAPAAITVAKIMIPETGPLTPGTLTAPAPACGTMDALTRGTLQGVQLLINILAMLVVLIAMVQLINTLLGLLPHLGGAPLTLQRFFGYLMAPVVYLMGIPGSEAMTAGALMGTKTVLNELIAYLDMSRLPPDALSPRSVVIMTYAMCGFANPGSLGIMIGGMGTMSPSRRGDIVALGLRSIVAGTLSTCMTGAVVGLLV
jgi:CNT family concentrative nucleoside transporter